MKLLLCDDHALFREGLRHVLEGLGEGYELIETAGAPEALAALEAHPDLDLVLLDLNLPGVQGFDALREMRESAPTVPVVMLSAAEEPEAMRAALECGAAGWVPKSSTGPVLRAALGLVLDGGVYVPPQALGAPAAAREPDSPLTPRQLDVAQLLMRGKTNKEICNDLEMAEGTCKTHLAAIFETLDVTNRTEAAAALRDLGIEPRRRASSRS